MPRPSPWEDPSRPWPVRPGGAGCACAPRARRASRALLALVPLVASLACGGSPAGNAVPPPPGDEAEPPVAGTLRFPAFLLRFEDTPDSLVPDASALGRTLAGAAPPSLPAYWRGVSRGRLDVVVDVDRAWRRVPFQKAAYDGRFLLDQAMKLVQQDTPAVDWSLYDNDGPDGRPSSGDDDGRVDLVLLVHSELGAECAPVAADASDIQTERRRASVDRPGRAYPGGEAAVVVDQYVVAAGQGGGDGCTAGAARGIGPVAHELGHVLGIPELYDNGAPTGPGIGRWGLMGFGGLQTVERPLSLSAWSLTQLGWVREAKLHGDTVVELPPAERAGTVHRIDVPGTAGYLLLENRQPLGADASLVDTGAYGGRLGPGLLVWHVDSTLVRERGFDAGSCWKRRRALCTGSDEALRNRLNAGPRPGVALEHADGALLPVVGAFTPSDPATGTPGDAFGPGDVFELPGVARLEVLAGREGEGSLRVRVAFDRRRTPVAADGAELPTGRVGAPYRGRVAAATEAGAPPLAWKAVAGRLPAGLTLEGDGSVTGTPTESGTYPLVVEGAVGTAVARLHVVVRVGG